MLKTIRFLNIGWVLLFISFILIFRGITMTEMSGEKTFLCSDGGCIYILDISNVPVGILMGIIAIFKSYPSYADAAVYIALLPTWNRQMPCEILNSCDILFLTS